MVRKTVDDVINTVDDIIAEGYSSDQIMKQFFQLILEDDEINVTCQSRILEKIASCEKRIIEGGRDDLTLYDLFCSCKNILNTPN